MSEAPVMTAPTPPHEALPARVHLIGIGGMALSAIAGVLLERGSQISGSDMAASAYTDRLRVAGATVHIGHGAANLPAADLVVFSAAVPDDNPEMIRARELGIPILRRAEFIGRLLDQRRGVAIAGTHGKTTTTAMLATILKSVGRDPGYLIGAAVPDLNGNSAWGTDPEFVIEADEYDSAFLEYRPHIAVINHLEPDHLDYFGSFERIRDEFRQFAAAVKTDGLLIARAGIPAIDDLVAAASCEVLRFGPGGDWQLVDFVDGAWGSTFDISDPNGDSHPARLPLPGQHNARNALAAVAAAVAIGLSAKEAIAGLSGFRGADRRFELLAEARGIRIVTDYAHHPTEVRAALAAAAGTGAGRVWAVFQPHLRSRTEDFFDDFAAAFGDADRVTITEIFSPPGRETGTLSGADLAAAISPPAGFAATLDAAHDQVTTEARHGDLIILIGAGDINRLAERLAQWLRS